MYSKVPAYLPTSRAICTRLFSRSATKMRPPYQSTSFGKFSLRRLDATLTVARRRPRPLGQTHQPLAERVGNKHVAVVHDRDTARQYEVGVVQASEAPTEAVFPAFQTGRPIGEKRTTRLLFESETMMRPSASTTTPLGWSRSPSADPGLPNC